MIGRRRSRILYLDHVENDGKLLFEQIVKLEPGRDGLHAEVLHGAFVERNLETRIRHVRADEQAVIFGVFWCHRRRGLRRLQQFLIALTIVSFVDVRIRTPRFGFTKVSMNMNSPETGERKDRLEGPDSASGPYALIWRPLTLEI